MRNVQKSMPALVLMAAIVLLAGLAWIEQREDGAGAGAGAGALRLIDAAAEAAADAPADAYMPGLFK